MDTRDTLDNGITPGTRGTLDTIITPGTRVTPDTRVTPNTVVTLDTEDYKKYAENTDKDRNKYTWHLMEITGDYGHFRDVTNRERESQNQ